MKREKIRNVIIGDGIILRLITMEDTELIVKWRNNPQVQKNFIFRETLRMKRISTGWKRRWQAGKCFNILS